MVFVSTPNPPQIPDTAAERCGVQRVTMRTNLLIHRSGLGECNKLIFTNPALEKTFGVPKQADPEGARELTMVWKEHKANPLDTPGPDFLSMNKHAAIKGLTSAPQQHQFRMDHPACLKNGEAVKKPAPLLPSDIDTEHVYGMPGTYRTAEQARAHEFDKRKAYITPKRTKSSVCTSQSPGNHGRSQTLFKLSKFTKVQPKVRQYMLDSGSAYPVATRS